MDVVLIPLFLWQIVDLVKELEFFLVTGLVKCELGDQLVDSFEDSFVFAVSGLEDNVNLLFAEVVLDVDELCKFARLLDEFRVVVVHKQNRKKIVLLTPALKTPVP